LVILSLLVTALVASPFIMVLAGFSFGINSPCGGPHANLMAGDYVVWDMEVVYAPETVTHTIWVWNITGSGESTFTMHTSTIFYNGTVSYENDSRDFSYWPHIGCAFGDSNINATPTVETIHTAFGEKRVYHYHCPEKSNLDGGSIPPSDTYIGVDTNVVYQSYSFGPGADITFTLKDTNAQSILDGDKL
jgi:hypothetical protein